MGITYRRSGFTLLLILLVFVCMLEFVLVLLLGLVLMLLMLLAVVIVVGSEVTERVLATAANGPPHIHHLLNGKLTTCARGEPGGYACTKNSSSSL